MNILFMSLGEFDNLKGSSVHIDVIKRFAVNHNVWLVCKNEEKRTKLAEEEGIHVLRVHTGKLKNIGLVKKGLSTVMIEPQFRRAIRFYLNDITFELIIYTTPPITFANIVKELKIKNGAVTYLMLKDIFPQNAVDIGMMPTTGYKGLIYRYFRREEKRLYAISDYIGCMSPANVNYVTLHNPEINKGRVEICPNISSIEDNSVDEATKKKTREMYHIPIDKKVFVYGGNLGKPQGIDHMLGCLHSQRNNKEAFFLIIGNGTEYAKIENYIKRYRPSNIMLHQWLPKRNFDDLVASCDIGMIFLDHRFTIPNFPSRLLSYMKSKLPVMAVTDTNTDVGRIIVENGFGWWCESNNVYGFKKLVGRILETDKSCIDEMKRKGYDFFINNYNPDIAYETIISKIGINNNV